jgi:hypothetical protein
MSNTGKTLKRSHLLTVTMTMWEQFIARCKKNDLDKRPDSRIKVSVEEYLDKYLERRVDKYLAASNKGYSSVAW